MDATRQIINCYINQSKAAFVSATNGTAEKPPLFMGNSALFTCNLFDSGGAAMALPVDAEFIASLDTDYGPGHADLVTAANDKFNDPADWDAIDLATGRFCFRLATKTAELIAAIAGAKRLTAHLEIWFREVGGEWAILLHEDVVIKNTAADVAAASSEVADNFDVASFAALPSAPQPAQSHFVETLGYPVYWYNAEACWVNALGQPVTAADE